MTSKRVLLNRFIDHLSKEELAILKWITALLKEVVPSHVKRFCLDKEISQRAFNSLLELLKREGYGSFQSKMTFLVHEPVFVLDAALRTEVLLRIADDDPDSWDQYVQLIDHCCSHGPYDFSPTSIEDNLYALLYFMRQGRVMPLDWDVPWQKEKHYLHDLMGEWIGYPKLYPLLDHQEDKLVYEVVEKQLQAVFLQADPSTMHDLELYFDRTTKRFPSLIILKQLYLVPRYLYKGEWRAFNTIVEHTKEVSPLVSFAYHFFQGNSEIALYLFDHYLKDVGKMQKKRPLLSGILFFDFLYISALMKQEEPTTKKLFHTIYRSKELQEKGFRYKSVRLLLQIALQYEEHQIELTYNPIDWLLVSDLLYNITAIHFQVREKLDVFLDSLKMVSLEGMALFVPELPEPLKRSYSNPKGETGWASFFIEQERTAAWERTLDALLGTASAGMNSTESEPVVTSRIIYLIDRQDEITPRLQKSKDGVTWSRGRSLSLKTFASNREGMTPFDKEMAMLVRTRREYGWRGYGADVHALSGYKAIKKLVGFPWVFREEAPDVAIDVAMHQPAISITKMVDGFRVEHNLPELRADELNYFFWDGSTRIRVVEMGMREFEVFRMLTQVGTFPLEAEAKLTQVMGSLSKELTIHSDLVATHDAAQQIETDSRLVVQIIPAANGFKAEIFVKPLGVNPPYCIPGEGNDTVMGQHDGKAIQAIRNKILEKNYMQQLKEVVDPSTFVENNRLQMENPLACLEFLDALYPLDFVLMEWPEGGKLRLKEQVDFPQITVGVKGKKGWFEVVGEVNMDDRTVELANLLEQLHENPYSRFIALGNDEYIALSQALRKKLYALDAITRKDKAGARVISEFAAPILSSWGNDGLKLKADQKYKELLARIDQVSVCEYAVPSRLQATLRPYQEDGFRWMARLADWGAGACLADDMGLGKTLQTIAMMLYRADKGASLVVAPASVLLNWQQEIMRFAPALTVKVMHGVTDRHELLDSAESYDVVLTTYGLLVSEQKRLCDVSWNMIVLDEAHTIKNRETQMSKAAMQLKGDFRLILTGTPLQNHLGEIWNLFQFINPGMLGTFDQFSARFIAPILEAGNVGQRELLKNLVAPFLLRRTKSEVLQELPGKTEIVVPVALNAYEMNVYETMRSHAEKKLEEGDTTIQTLAEITRLRQAASHVGMVRDGVDLVSSKMKAFFDLLEEMKENGHRALVFSQFTSHLAIFQQALDKQQVDYLYLDGSTPVKQRAKLVKEFQTGEQPLFLISLKAGGLGLNLTAADFIIHLDPWWNPAIEDQASDRAYRIGQKRPVTVYRLIASNTIEEKIIALHQTKKDLADSLLEGTNMSHKLTREELLELVKL